MKADMKVDMKTNSETADVSEFSILTLREQLQKEMGCNFHAVPNIEKVVISVCLGRLLNDSKKMEQIKQQLTNITGRMPVNTKAKKSVSSFKIRTGMHLGYKVTLRKQEAENFLFKLIYITMPRMTDFRGVSHKAFDGLGNYNLGIKRADVFLEIDHNIEMNFGMNIAIGTTAREDAKAKLLLEKMMFPFFKQ